MSNYNPRGGYENRSLLKEAIANRLVREFELESLYKSPEVAAVEVMHKYDGTRQDMAWVLMGDSIAKSGEVFAFIDNVIKQFNPQRPGKGLGQANRQQAMDMLPGFQEESAPGAGDGSAALSGGASQQTAGGNQQSHAPKQGLGSRFKTWAKERAMPAMGRGLRHLGAFTAGGIAGGPLGALGGLGASMAQAHRGKQTGQYGKVMGGEGGLGQLAGDAAKQGMVGVKNAAGQQAQNFQTGQGAMGKIGQAAGAAKILGGKALQGMKNMASNAAQGVSNAMNQAGQQQQANLQQQNPDLARQQLRLQNANAQPPQQPQQPAAGGAPPAGGTPLQGDPNAQPQQGEIAQANPSAIQQITDSQGPQTPADGGQAPLGGQPGMFANAGNQAQQNLQQIQTSNDTFSRINDILKGW